MFPRGTNVPADEAVLSERPTSVRVFVGHNFRARRCQGVFVEIEVAKKGGMGREGGMNSRGAKEVECESCLRD